MSSGDVIGQVDLGVSSEKQNRWFKDIMQISADPYLILDIFILDKYKLVFTPPPPTEIWTKTNFFVQIL